MTSNHTVQECLDAIGVTNQDLEQHQNSPSQIDDEFKTIKKTYFQRILASHPDKGGDPEVFRQIQTSFEVLRTLYKNQSLSTFLDDASQEVPNYDDLEEEFRTEGEGAGGVPSWEFYQEAAKEDVPGYCVEPAKSGRSKCKQTTKDARKCPPNSTIDKGELRVGSLDKESGTYTRWNHLACWRVPSRVWLGLDGLFKPQFVKPKSKRGKGHYVSFSGTVVNLAAPASGDEDDENDEENDEEEEDDDDDDDDEEEEEEDTTAIVSQQQPQYDPAVIQVALKALERMDGVVLVGFSKLSQEQKLQVVNHVLNQDNHARLMSKFYEDLKKEEAEQQAAAAAIKAEGEEDEQKMPALPKSDTAAAVSADPSSEDLVVSSSAAAAGSSTAAGVGGAVVPLGNAEPQRFVTPKPGINGAIENALSGQTCVISGVFPECGGGAGLSLGKERVKDMIVSFGGRCTSGISGKTTFLIAGKSPGASKVGKARAKNIPVISLHELKLLCEGKPLDAAEPALIGSFSAGYMGRNGKALEMPQSELDQLRKTTPATKGKALAIEADSEDQQEKKGKKKKPSAAAAKKKKATTAKRKTAPLKKSSKKAAAAADTDDYEEDAVVNDTNQKGLQPRSTNTKKRKAAPKKKGKAAKITEEDDAENQNPEDDNGPAEDESSKPRAGKKRKTAASRKKKSGGGAGEDSIADNKDDSGMEADGDDDEMEEEPTDGVSALFPGLDNLKVKELKELCKLNGMQVSGTKAALKQRLVTYAAAATAASPAASSTCY